MKEATPWGGKTKRRRESKTRERWLLGKGGRSQQQPVVIVAGNGSSSGDGDGLWGTRGSNGGCITIGHLLLLLPLSYKHSATMAKSPGGGGDFVSV